MLKGEVYDINLGPNKEMMIEASFAPDSTFFVASYYHSQKGGGIHIFDTIARRKIRTISHGYDSRKGGFVISPDCYSIVCIHPETSLRSNYKGVIFGKCCQSLNCDDIAAEEDIECVAISSCGMNIVAGSSEGNIRVWDVETGKTNLKWNCNGYVSAIAFSHDKKFIATTTTVVKIWDAKTGIQIKEIDGYFGMHFSNSCMFSKNGKRLLTGRNMIDVSTGSSVNWRLYDFFALAFAGQHDEWVIASSNYHLSVLDVETQTTLFITDGYIKGFESLYRRISPDLANVLTIYMTKEEDMAVRITDLTGKKTARPCVVSLIACLSSSSLRSQRYTVLNRLSYFVWRFLRFNSWTNLFFL